MPHELRSRGATPLQASEVATRLKAEFRYLRIDPEEGRNRAIALAEWIESAPEALFLGKHQQALESAAKLKSLRDGDALAIEFGDEPDRTLRIVVIPGETIKFGYGSNAEQDASAPLAERCARALGYDMIVV